MAAAQYARRPRTQALGIPIWGKQPDAAPRLFAPRPPSPSSRSASHPVKNWWEKLAGIINLGIDGRRRVFNLHFGLRQPVVTWTTSLAPDVQK